MRIIDKNTDFYDFYQNIYRDDSTTFDRTDSFLLTKEIMCEYLYSHKSYWDRKNGRNNLHNLNFVLLQVCNTFWLFLAETTKTDEHDRPQDYSIEVLETWKNYEKNRVLISVDVISFDWDITHLVSIYKNGWEYEKESILKKTSLLIQSINMGNYKINRSINSHTIYHGDNKQVEKHLPLLKASGMSVHIDPLEIYLSFEEYFSLEKTSMERIYSKDITDEEKIENHGFDTKVSFRGKYNK